MKLETRVTLSTKVDKKSYTSNVTIDWTGMTDDDLQALAQRSIVIRKQNADRTKGVIPEEEYVLKAVDYRIGVRTARPVVLTTEQMLDAMSDEEFEEHMREQLAKRKASKEV
jgi:hypothetical protein